AGEPAEFETAIGQGRREAAAQMRTALAPVQAGAGEMAALARHGLDIDAELAEEPAACGGETEHLGVVVVTDQTAPGDQLVEQADAKPAGDVVITGARLPQRAGHPGPVMRRH